MTWFCPHAFSNIFLFHRYHPSTNLTLQWPCLFLTTEHHKACSVSENYVETISKELQPLVWQGSILEKWALVRRLSSPTLVMNKKTYQTYLEGQHMKWKHTVDTTFSGTNYMMPLSSNDRGLSIQSCGTGVFSSPTKSLAKESCIACRTPAVAPSSTRPLLGSSRFKRLSNDSSFKSSPRATAKGSPANCKGG